MKTLRLAVLGFGNAGRAYARLLLEKDQELRQQYGMAVQVTAIVTGRHGTWEDPAGIDLHRALADFTANSSRTGLEVARDADYDALVELTPLNIATGQPAIDHIRTALSRGKHVISANKGPIAWAYRELKALAEEQKVGFYHETTVMDGAPVFDLVERTLPLARVTEVSGILNTTTNYILEDLAAGKDYDAILAEGRRLGFVEADPAMDVEGYDAAAKLTALLNVLMDADLTPDRVERQGIQNITAADIRDAAARGKVIKLLCRGWREGGVLHATVSPAEVDRGSLYATIDSTSSLVSITTDLMGKLSLVEHAPLIEQTGYGILVDTVRLLQRLTGICP